MPQHVSCRTPSASGADVDDSLEMLVNTALSRLIGEMNGGRAPIYKLCSIVSIVARQEYADAEGVHPAIAPDFNAEIKNASTVLKHQGWSPAYLDQLWDERLVTLAVYAQMPEEVVHALVPTDVRRVLTVLAALGPAEANARFVAGLRAYALRASRTGARRGEPVGGGSIEGLYTAARRFMRALCELQGLGYIAPPGSAAAKALAQWTVLPPHIRARDLSRAENGGRVPRRPPTEALLRLGLARQHQLLTLRRRANGSLRDRTGFKPFRDAALVGVVCTCGSRKGALFQRPDGPIRVGDYDPRHAFERTSVVGPALRIITAQKGSRSTQARNGYSSQWIPLPPPVADALETYLEIIGTRHLPQAPLWIREWQDKARTIPNLDDPLDVRAFDYIVEKTFGPEVVRGGYVFSPHNIRHTLEPALAAIGTRWLNGDLPLPPGFPTPSETERISYNGQVIADAVQSHSYRGLDPNGYKHCEDNRERFTLVGVFGMWELLTGELGARHGPDIARRLRADHHYAELQAEIAGCEARLSQLGADSRALIRQMARTSEAEGLVPRLQARKWELEEDRLAENARLQATQLKLVLAREELDAAYRARVPLADRWLPDRQPDEPIRLDEAAIRTHRTLQTIYWWIEKGRLEVGRRGRRYYTSLAALGRAGLLDGVGDEINDPEPLTMSPHLTSQVQVGDDVPIGARVTIQSGARIFMKCEATIKRWALGKLPHPAGDPRNPWQPNPDSSQLPDCIEGDIGGHKRIVVTPSLAIWLRRHPEIRSRFALALAGRL